MAQGQTVVLSDPIGNLVNASGTSFSCPITSGMVACLWQGFARKNAQQIKQLIQQSSDNFAEPAVKSRPQYGYGIPDFNLALANGCRLLIFRKLILWFIQIQLTTLFRSVYPMVRC